MNPNIKNDFPDRLIKFSIKVIGLAGQLKNDSLYRSIADQIVKSSTSIGANIVEAKGSGSKRDYTRFFEIALKSSHETKYWLKVIGESRPELAQDVATILDETEQISKIIAASIITMKGR